MENVNKKFLFINADGDGVTANQAYQAAKQQGYTGTFNQFMEKYGNKGYLKDGVDLFKTIKGLFGAGDAEPAVTPGGGFATVPTPPKFLGMPAWAGITVAVVAVSLIGYGIYKLAK